MLPAPISAALLLCPLPVPPAAPAQVDPPHALLTNINQVPIESTFSYPQLLASDGQRVILSATSVGTGRELWVSDGTDAGTQSLGEVLPGPEGIFTFQSVGEILADGRALIAIELTATVDSTLWVSDFTAGGTAQVTDQSVVQPLYNFVRFGDEVWFHGRSGATGHEWWRSDGTAAGTQLAFEVTPGADFGVPPDIYEPVVSGEHLFFVGTPDGSFAAAPQFLYVTDGGAPAELLELSYGQVDDLGAGIGDTGRALILRREPGPIGQLGTYQWWVTDGTVAGTTFLMDAPDQGPWSVESGDRAFFNGVASNGTVQLYVTDGTVAGTTLAADTSGGQSAHGVSIAPGAAVAGGVVFQAWFNGAGFEPAFSDGTVAGTVKLADTGPGTGAALWGWSLAADGLAYVGLDPSPSTIGRLLVTDGTPGGTVVRDTSDLDGFVGNAALPLGASIVHPLNFDLGLSTSVQTENVGSIGTTVLDGGSFAHELVRFGDRVLFAADDGVSGYELWSTDGVDAVQVADLAPGAANSHPRDFVVVGDRVAFTADDGIHGRELWWTDGTGAGTVLVDVEPGPESSAIDSMVESRGLLFIGTSPTFTPGRLLVADGGLGVSEVAPFLDLGSYSASVGFGSQPPVQMVAAGDVRDDVALFFNAAPAGTSDAELWATDGTAAGTFQVAEIRVGPDGSFPRSLTVVDDKLFLAGRMLGTGHEPIVSDGTAAGTVALGDLLPGPMSSVPVLAEALAVDGRWVFEVDDGVNQSLLWQSDGTPAGTKPLAAPGSLPGWGGSNMAVNDVVASDGRLAILTTDAFGGPYRLFELPSVDGALAQVAEVAAAQGLWPLGSNGDVVFNALWTGVPDVSVGEEPRVLRDGGAVELLLDVYPGPADSDSRPGLTLGSQVVFPAIGPLAGSELRTVGTGTAGTWVGRAIGRGCGEGGALTPRLGAGGSATLGGTLVVELDRAAPFAPAALAFGTGLDLQPIGGACGLLLPAPTVLASSLTGSEGATTFSLPVPADPALIEAELYFQAIVLDAVGPFLGLASTSDGLEVVVGP